MTEAPSRRGSILPEHLVQAFSRHDCAQCVEMSLLASTRKMNFAVLVAREIGMNVSRSAAEALAMRLPGDRGQARRSIEVAALHALSRSVNVIEAGDVIAVMPEVDETDLHSPLEEALQGRLPDAFASLAKLEGRGERSLDILRTWQRRILRLRKSRKEMERDQPASRVIATYAAAERAGVRRIIDQTPLLVFDQALSRLDLAEVRIVVRQMVAQIETASALEDVYRLRLPETKGEVQ